MKLTSYAKKYSLHMSRTIIKFQKQLFAEFSQKKNYKNISETINLQSLQLINTKFDNAMFSSGFSSVQYVIFNKTTTSIFSFTC